MSKEVSVIIPTRNEYQNLIWTLQAAMADLEGRDYELIPVFNRCHPDEPDKLERYWPFQHGRGQVVIYDDEPSCWQARNAGAAVAEGDYLLFLDSHVIPASGSFHRLIDFHRGWQGVAHCALNYWLEPKEKTLYGYTWQPDKFWGNWTRHEPKAPDYYIPLSGTSSSLIDRETFEEVRGWHPKFGVYGGGETYMDLLVQMYGHSVRMHPANRLWHLTETRGYRWTNEELRHNFMLAAFVLGGFEWLDRVYEHFKASNRGVEKYDEALAEIRTTVIMEGAEEREYVEAHAQFTLNDVVETFQAMR